MFADLLVFYLFLQGESLGNQLGHNTYMARQRAEAQLMKMPELHFWMDSLHKQTNDFEVLTRTEKILDKFEKMAQPELMPPPMEEDTFFIAPLRNLRLPIRKLKEREFLEQQRRR